MTKNKKQTKKKTENNIKCGNVLRNVLSKHCVTTSSVI